MERTPLIPTGSVSSLKGFIDVEVSMSRMPDKFRWVKQYHYACKCLCVYVHACMWCVCVCVCVWVCVWVRTFECITQLTFMVVSSRLFSPGQNALKHSTHLMNHGTHGAKQKRERLMPPAAVQHHPLLIKQPHALTEADLKSIYLVFNCWTYGLDTCCLRNAPFNSSSRRSVVVHYRPEVKKTQYK